jgi:hypothetical protein
MTQILREVTGKLLESTSGMAIQPVCSRLTSPNSNRYCLLFRPALHGLQGMTSQEDTVQLDGLDWDQFLCIGLADAGEVSAGPEYARGSRMVNKMQDAGKQVPGPKQVLQMCGRLCNIDINSMDDTQDPEGKQEACICKRLQGWTSGKVWFCRVTFWTHNIVFANTPFIYLLPTCQLFWIPHSRLREKDGEEVLTVAHGQ